MGGEAITLHRHPPPLREFSLLGPRPGGLLPGCPEFVKDLLVKIGRQVGPRKQEFEPLGSGCRGPFYR